MDDRPGDDQAKIKRPSLKPVKGTLFTSCFLHECVESAIDYAHKEGDLFIATYIKCGTTWMQHIVYLILNDGAPPASAADLYKTSPYFEVCGSECLQWMRRPGAIKTHMPLRLMRYSPKARYIVVIRNPFDVVVSIHHFWHMVSVYSYDGCFGDTFENFMAGYVDSGDYFAFYREWCEHRKDPNVLFLVYEEMRKDPEAAILKVARFLGAEYEERLLVDEGKVLKDVLKYSSFEEMKKYTNKMTYDFYGEGFPFEGEEYEGLRHLHGLVRSGSTGDGGGGSGGGEAADKIDFVRKGAVGDWRNYFSPEQTKRLKERFLQETRGSGMANLWADIGLRG
ncbi:hypothetical protein V5799_030986 [Amblyomma americanum]|uniref:Sulfotransferase domain-containing protein n=1 Tax=Amblyomma americanum TaxID=6943 RepID=A0AAQ4EM63_AMBAM